LYNPNYLIDDENLGGDGQIETKINPNDDGTFEDGLFDQVYVYPLRKAFDDNGNKTPINILPEEDRVLSSAYCAFLVDLNDIEKIWNIQTFEDCVEFNNNLTYAIKSYNNSFTEIPKESLNKYSKKSLYVKLENNEYEPFLDYALKETENGGSLKNSLFYKTRKKTYITEFIDGGIYIKNKDKKIV
jgi:hypothetical protein